VHLLETGQVKRKGSGAAPFIALNPASMAVKFVMARNDIKRNVKKTAAKIASQVALQCESPK
jgi:hypothetical protein